MPKRVDVMNKKRRMKIKFHAKLSHFIFTSGFVLLVGGCSESPDSVSVKPKRPVIQVAKILPDATYARALSLASTPREQAIVEVSRRLEGKRRKPNVDSKTIQTMQEVLLESETPEVRAATAAGLGNASNIDSVPSLLDAMEDDSLLTRQAAGKAVGKLMGWRHGFQADDPSDKRAEAVERFRERWLLFEGSDLYQLATNPEVRERARAIAEKRAKFARRRERLPAHLKKMSAAPADVPGPEILPPPQSRPSADELRLQLLRLQLE